MAATLPAQTFDTSVAQPTHRGGPSNKSLMMLGAGLALFIGLISAAVLWSRNSDYKVLFANVSDKDGGAILAQLSQMNIPYKHADGGGAILVPADSVYDARLKLASMGLPKGGGVGFELLENQRFGATQFQEQINFQRGLEGELAKSIQSIASVQSARVHLALPKQSTFLREQQKPSASVILNLYPGRTLDRQQIAGIVHLVSSSVPELSPKNVTAVDQQGSLLSETGAPGAGGLDPDKLSYVNQIEQGYNRRVMDLIEAVVGRNNVRAQITADIDFSMVEQTAETFKPNVGMASIRSSAVHESAASGGSGGAAGGLNGGQGGASGIPGSLSNQPPANATATLQAAAGTAGAAGGSSASGAGASGPGVNGGPLKRDQTTNYEVDKTIRTERRPVGTIKRLSAAVVVNHARVTEGDKVSLKALSEADLAKITSIVRDAIGFSQERGDTVNVVNVPFNVEEKLPEVEVPIWKQPDNIAMARDAGKGLAYVVGLLLILFGVIRPTLKTISQSRAPIPAMVTGPAGGETPAVTYTPSRSTAQAAANSAAQLDEVRQLARSEPATVANVVRSWMNKEA